MSFDLGGFSITASTSQVMLIIFAIYSVVIVGFGFYIKYQSRKGGKDGLASFLTGGGGLGAFAIAMIAATNSMAGGTMVAAPGLGYSVGFTAALVYYAGFLTAAYGLGSVGRKVAILRDRTGAVTFQQLLGLRFQSKKVVGALAITGAFGLTFFAVGQITSGAKVFAAVTGSNSYYLGILLTIVITIDSETSEVVAGPDIVTRGFVYVRESEQLIKEARAVVTKTLDKCLEREVNDWADLKLNIREALSMFLFQKTKRSPMILPIIMEV